MIAVMDASAAIEIALFRNCAENFIRFLEDSVQVIAPDLFISESANVFWKYNLYGNLPQEICERSLERAIQIVDDFHPTYDLYQEALSLSLQIKHPVYDSMYLVLARRNNAILLTMDKKLYQIATGLSIKTFFPLKI